MKALFLTLISIFTVISHSFAQDTQIVAHRGAWKNTHAIANSIGSLQKAIDMGLWGSEFDVHLTKDGILIVNHDADFYGIDIASSTYEQLLTKKHPNGEALPTAEEFLKIGLKQKKTKLVFELKTSALDSIRIQLAVKKSVKLVKSLKALNQVEFIAFDWNACLGFRALDKDLTIYYLNGDKTAKEVKEANLSGIDYNWLVYKKQPSLIKECKSLGLLTNVWTVNKEEDLKYFVQQKIDYITTVEPELLKTLLQ